MFLSKLIFKKKLNQQLLTAATHSTPSNLTKQHQYLHSQLLQQQQQSSFLSKQQQIDLIKLRDLNTTSLSSPGGGGGGGQSMPIITSTSSSAGKNKLNGHNKMIRISNGGMSGGNGGLKVKFPPKKIKQEKTNSPLKQHQHRYENGGESGAENGINDHQIDIEYDDEHMQMQHDDMMADDNVSDSEYNNNQQQQLNLSSIIKQQPQQYNNYGTPNGGGSANGTPNGGVSNLEYECAACEKKFKYFCYYKRHMDACHSEWPKYVCDTCSKSYKWEASFRQHLRSHHANLAGQYGAMGSGMPPTQAELAAAAAAVCLSQNGGDGGIPYDEEYIADDVKNEKVEDVNQEPQQSHQINNDDDDDDDVVDDVDDHQQQQQQQISVTNENSI